MNTTSDLTRNGKPLTHRDKFPCKDCQERTVGCHAVCMKYYAARLNADKRKEVELQNRHYESNCNAREMARRNKKPREI